MTNPGMRRLIVQATAAGLLLHVSIGAAVPIPFAESQSEITVLATLTGASPGDAVPVYAATSLQAAAVALGNGSTPTMHLAEAAASAIATPKPVGSDSVASFQLAHATSAWANAAQPLFARAAVSSTAGADLADIIPTTTAIMNLTWDVASLMTRSQPTTSFSILRHTATVTQSPANPAGQETTASVGFVLVSDNGRLGAFALDLPSDATVGTWLGQNLAAGTGGLYLPDDAASGFSVAFPLYGSGGAGVSPSALNVSMRIDHLEYSAEAPPVAVPRVAEQAGSTGESSLVHWDPAAQTLTFDILPIDILSPGGREFIDARFANDPLAGGLLQIDPMQLLLLDDGRRWFSGDQVRLISSTGETLFSATLPGMVFDESLVDAQGFNFFAPILNILDLGVSDSPWLQAFSQRNRVEAPVLPGFFLGFDVGSWEQGFSAVPRAVISFSGLEPLPAPATAWLLGLGLIAIGTVWRGHTTTCKNH